VTAARLQWEKDRPPWVWWQRLDRRNGYLAWGPVGTVFNRRRPLHWAVAVVALWRNGRR
jgi:hypothetical protein